MKLVTFQSMDAVKDLFQKGYLECDPKFIDLKKSGPTYDVILSKFCNAVYNPEKVDYPIWCWVKFKKGICPPKHKGKKVSSFDVKITFHKKEEQVLITDYRRFSFLLNNLYIPTSKKDKERFDKKLEEYKITKEELKAYVRKDKYETHRMDDLYLSVCKEIRDSFSRVFTKDSDVLQGCVSRVYLEEIEKIEFLMDEDYCYGSFNYVRWDGKRFNWREDFYRKLK